ncbi:sensor histidine kinase [Sphingomicrobium clamense]|uniref:histidine kinase n=1 Tax=Sphingomicrobium clamense TaxID=2851013 RepID=A0ABS6V6B8_9SPHN|nr:PAS domain-containing sensor histidine kinase [Sphingomicrobium sp. B8]MBW0145059.1 PAS-domain containing protein [Sphingomicrobium sp. B8]
MDGLLLIIAALWMGIAAALLVVAGRRMDRARKTIDAARSLAGMMGAAPVRPAMIDADGKLDADPELLRQLAVSGRPSTLAELGAGAGISRDTVKALESRIAEARLSGERFSLQVEAEQSGKIFDISVMPAPRPAADGTMLSWWADTSQQEEERGRLGKRLDQTESALDSLTQLIESAPFPMWYRGPDLALGLVNAAFVAAVEGDTAADVIARGAELIDGTGDESARAGAMTALENGKPYSRTQPATIGGERRMLRIVDVPLATGAVAGFAIDVQDIEDARYELAQYIQSQRDLSDRMTAGAAQFDSDKRLSFYNQPFAVMAGLDVEELDAKPEFDRLLEQMRDKGRTPETRDFPAWKAERRAWFTATDELIEEDWILANGDHQRVVGQPLPDGGLRLIIEDRTEQVRLASARDTLLRVRAATFDNLFEVISVFASDGRLYLWNKLFTDLWELEDSWLSEHPRIDELVPLMAKKLKDPEDATRIRELVSSTTSGRKENAGRLQFADGRSFAYSSVPLPDGNALVTLVDVTDSTRIQAALRERAEALEEADRVKTDFVANMSYELRTPLTSIGGFAEMLQQGYAGTLEDKAKGYVDAIMESVERLSRLIDNVLDLTRTEGGELKIDRKRVDMAGLCRNAVAAMTVDAAAKDQSIEEEIADSTGDVTGDAKRLREAIDHLLRNAIAYAGPGGRIELYAHGDEDAVTVSVADDGPGIPVEEQEEVFNRFHKVHDAASRSETALGLGLPLTRQFVEAHGGNVSLDSTPGRGTTVTLRIPRGAQ